MTIISEEDVEKAHKALMSELFVICQPKWGNVFAFMDAHPEVLKPVLESVLLSREAKDEIK